jgi:hypothetical protein
MKPLSRQTRARGLLTLLALLTVPCAPLSAQDTTTAATGLRAQPSGRARTTVTLVRGGGDTAPATISIDYGQPHARGRSVVGGIVQYDALWRTGANQPTMLRTDVDLLIGGVVVPKGAYMLCTLPSRGGWKLIINKNSTTNDFCPADQDLARVDLRLRQLREPLDSFTIWLVPEVTRTASGGIGDGLGRGVLRLAWGDVELSTDWSVR